MATWAEFTSYVKSNFKVQSERGPFLTLVFDVGDGRTQLAVLQHAQLMNDSEDWVIITSPIGEVASVNLKTALEKVGEFVVGGLAVEGGMLVLKHTLPLANLDTNEFLRPLQLVIGSADDLEAAFVGGDRF